MRNAELKTEALLLSLLPNRGRLAWLPCSLRVPEMWSRVFHSAFRTIFAELGFLIPHSPFRIPHYLHAFGKFLLVKSLQLLWVWQVTVKDHLIVQAERPPQGISGRPGVGALLVLSGDL